MDAVGSFFSYLWEQSGTFAMLFDSGVMWQSLAMLAIGAALLCFCAVKSFRPLFLVPLAIGVILINLTDAGREMLIFGQQGALELRLLSLTVKSGLIPCLVLFFLGASTDFSVLLSSPISLILGAGSQLGVFAAFALALGLGLEPSVAAAAAASGSANIAVSTYAAGVLSGRLSFQGAVSAAGCAALLTFILPRMAKGLTSKKARGVRPPEIRSVSKRAVLCFDLIALIICVFALKALAAPIGALMLGNLFKVCGIFDLIFKNAARAMRSAATAAFGFFVGLSAQGAEVFKMQTLLFFAVGLFSALASAFAVTALSQLLYVISKGRFNPLIGAGAAAADAAPARAVSALSAQSGAFILPHALGAGLGAVIASAVSAGLLSAVI